VNITKKEFQAYEDIRKSGHWNMLTNGRDAADEAGLYLDRYFEVLKNYDACTKKWPSVRPTKATAGKKGIK